MHRLCLENISLQERLLRLPCYESCLPRVNNSHYEDDHHVLKEEERDHSSNEIGDMDDSYNRSNNMRSSRINLKALQKLKSDKSSVIINPQNNVKLSFGTFLYKNYRYVDKNLIRIIYPIIYELSSMLISLISDTISSSYLIYSLHHQIPLFLQLALLLLILLYPIIKLLSIYYLSSYLILSYKVTWKNP